MSRRTKLITLLVLLVTIAIIVSRVVLAVRLSEPLQFRFVGGPVTWQETNPFGEREVVHGYEIEAQNASSFPIMIYNMRLTGTDGYASLPGGFAPMDLPERDTGGYPQYYGMVIPGHAKARFSYQTDAPTLFNAGAKEGPVVNYVWISCTLDRIDGWLQKCTPKTWASHLPLIEPLATQTPLGGMGPQSIPSPR
ncbi:MAG: hypothetical protein ACAH88_14305 [Roseimicrobium sp.]